jgi:hypothetical protein
MTRGWVHLRFSTTAALEEVRGVQRVSLNLIIGREGFQTTGIPKELRGPANRAGFRTE